MEYIYIVLCLIGSAFFSASEIAYTSMSKLKMKKESENLSPIQKVVHYIYNHFDHALSTILIGNNLVNIAATSIGTVLAVNLAASMEGAITDDLASTITTVVMTVLILIFGEITPKMFAKRRNEGMAKIAAYPLRLLMIILSPAVLLTAAIVNGLSILWRKDEEDDVTITEEEFENILDDIEDEGIIDENQTDLLQSALEFTDMTAEEILTHRIDVIGFELRDSMDYILETISETQFSRYPVYDRTIDHIVGVVRAKDLLLAEVSGQRDLRKLITPVMFVHSTMSISTLLNDLRRQKMQMAIVTDDYGGTLGLVTMEDCLEELVGEIWDEYDKVEEEFVDLGNDVYEVSGEMNIYDMFDNLDINTRNFESDYNTLSGWCVEQMEHIPQVGECFSYENLRVTVKEMEEQRITKLTVERFPLPESDEDED